MVIGVMALLRFFKAFKYSIPSVLLGWFKSSRSILRSKEDKAAALACGNVYPSFKYWRSACWYSSGSSTRRSAAAESSSKSPDSLPKHRWLTPIASNNATPQAAKSSALLEAKTGGSSTTRSAPASSAMAVRVYLSKTAGPPRCTKSPLMAAIQ